MRKLLLLSVISLTGFLHAQNVKFTVYNQANTPAFTTNAFKQIAIGKYGHVWAGSANAGLYKFNGTSWVKATVLLNNNIRTITRGADSSIVVGQAGYNAVQATTGGVNKFNDTTFNYTYWGSLTGGLPSRYVNGVCVSYDGTVWAANGQDLTAGVTKEGGISYLTTTATNFTKINTGLPASDIRIYAIAASHNEIWAAIDRACPTSPCTPSGILRYSYSGTYLGKIDATNSPIPFNSGIIIRAMCFTGTDIAWVGFNNGGLAVYSGGVWKLVNSTNSRFPSGATVNVNAIKADPNGKVYIGTSLGLLVYSGGSFTDTASYHLYTTADGLPSGNVTGIETMNYKTTWLTTGAGIVKMEEMFLPDPNGWKFSNSSANIWPAAWYSQFNYNTDPYLGGAVPFPPHDSSGVLVPFISNVFPDWPLFVSVVGENQCYNTVAGAKVVKIMAVNKWFSIIGNWGGSCFGFVQSSFMAYDSIQRFRATFPNVGNWTSPKLFDLPLNDNNRKCINYMMTKQSQQTYWNYINGIWNNTPRQTLAEVRTMLNSNTKNQRGLLLYNQNGSGGHIVNPYKIVRDTTDPDVRFIYIYDNNYPGDTTRRVAVDSLLNCWYYNLSINANNPAHEWGGIMANKGLILCTPVRDWYNPVNINNVAKSPYQVFLPSPGNIELYHPDSSDIIISNASGQKEGYISGKLLQNIPGAIPMLGLTSANNPPKGYYLPEDEYNITLSNFRTPASSMNFYNNIYFFGFSRSGAGLSQKDMLHISGDGIEVNNPDNTAKTISLKTVFDNAGNEVKAEIRKMAHSNLSSISLHVTPANTIKLTNSGNASTYELTLQYVNNSGDSKFLHDSVPIAANTSHLISPVWDSLKTLPVMVLVDNQDNGSIEDTLYLGNEKSPVFLTFPSKLEKGTEVSTDTIHILNTGGGVLHWTAASSDTSWLKIHGNTTGTDTGSIIIQVMANNSGNRTAQIILSDADQAISPYIINLEQEGIINPPAGLNASDGTSSDGVHIRWNSTTLAGSYRLSRSENAGSDGTVLTPWMQDTMYHDTTSLKGQFYYYRVQAAADSLGNAASGLSTADDGWRAGFTADFTWTGYCSGQPVTFTENSNAHGKTVSSWDYDQDGQEDAAGAMADHVFPGPGTYPVTLTMTLDNTYTETVTQNITMMPFPAVTQFGDTTVCAGQTLILDAGSGFDSYLWSTGAATQTVSLDTAGFGPGSTAVNVKVTSANGCSVLSTAYITWDTCAIQGSSILSGVVSYDNAAASPMTGTTVILKQNGNVTAQVLTGNQGEYLFDNLQPGTYQIEISTPVPWGGVNAIDALKIIRHFVGLDLLEDLRLQASDVNANDVINSTDALLVARRFVGLDSNFAAGDWIFTAGEVIISGSGNQTVNIKALSYGDVDGSYVP